MTDSITNNPDEYLWVQKFRPSRVQDTILPDRLKAPFQAYVDSGNVPNLLLLGGPGCGKTTVAIAMLKELDADFMIVNGSLNVNMDALRNSIANYASSMSLTGGRKYVIIDEADHMSGAIQAALRGFFEEFSNTGFILTGNYGNKIIDPIKSRCSVIEFNVGKKDIASLGGQFYKRVKAILEQENVTYEPKAVQSLIAKYYPDWRRVLNELQRYAPTGHIDAGVLVDLGEERFKELITAMKEKKFSTVRKWISEADDLDSTVFFRKFYDMAYDLMEPGSVPQLVVHLGEYSYRAAFVADQQINFAAFSCLVMSDCSFKE